MPHRLFTLHARAASAGLKDESDARSACRPARWHSRLLYAAFLLFGIAGPTQAQTAGPQAAYSLDEGSGTVVTDVSGHGNTLDLVNAPVWSTGHYGGALSFNGTNNRAVARAYNAALGLTGRSFTLSAWIYPRTNSGWQMIVNKPARSGHSAPYFDWSLHRETSTGRIVGYLGCDGQQRTSSASTPLNTWTHVAVSYDGTSLRHYINGALDRTTALTCAVVNTSSQPIRLGANGGNGEVMNGLIDDVRVYSRVLTAAEIQSDMGTALGGGSAPPPADTTAPTVALSAPASGATVSGTVTVTATATDNVGVAGVQFRLDGANLGAQDPSAPYSIAWPTAGAVTNGAHVLTAVASDAAGNVATSAAVTVTVANATPTLSVTLSASPASGNAPLAGVDLMASVSGSATGPITYTFYCNRSDTGTSVSQPWALQIVGTTLTAPSAVDVCIYSQPGLYTAKVIAQRASLAAEARATVNASAPVSPVQVSLDASPTSVASGGSSALTWSTTNATACTASGGWSGARATAGSASTGALTAATNTFTLTCTGAGGTGSDSAVVTVTGGAAQAGLDFQGNESTTGTTRFRFRNPLAIYPATYVWKFYPRQQDSYYTTFFWGNDDGANNLSTFLWDNGNSNSFYGAHPYPDYPNRSVHHWEIATDRSGDYVSNEVVAYNRWYTQALIAWSDGAGKHTVFYWDLPDTSKVITHVAPSSYGNVNPPQPALTFGDAPWNPSQEIMNGVIRNIQIYSAQLSVSDVIKEVGTPLSTATGTSNIWYMNLNPTPTDISDKSGAGHNPQWVGSERPKLWNGP